MRVSFQDELDQLCAAIQEEGNLVLRSLRAALNALAAHDVELANEVIRFDDEVDRSYAEIERGIESLLARQTPVAVDLRLVLAMLHINLHLERMGDYCVTTAKLIKLSEGLPGRPRLIEGLEEMGDRCEEMIRVALDSFAARDIDAATSRADRPRQPPRRRAHSWPGRRPVGARVGSPHAADLPLPRADRRPRGRHRRADGLPRLRRVPGVHGRLAPPERPVLTRLPSGRCVGS
jgi:hypothetical protein